MTEKNMNTKPIFAKNRGYDSPVSLTATLDNYQIGEISAKRAAKLLAETQRFRAENLGADGPGLEHVHAPVNGLDWSQVTCLHSGYEIEEIEPERIGIWMSCQERNELEQSEMERNA